MDGYVYDIRDDQDLYRFKCHSNPDLPVHE
jgi:hypothetical protein